MAPVQLYLAPISVNTHGVWFLLRAANVDHEVCIVDLMKGEQNTPEFLALNPKHTVPTLKNGDFSLWESNAILRYVCNEFKLDEWYPTDPKERARVDLALDWRQNNLYKNIANVCYSQMGFSQDSSQVESGRAALQQEFQFLESYLLNNRKFVGGNSPCIADLAIVTALSFLKIDKQVVIPERVELYRQDLVELYPQIWNELQAPVDGYFAYLASQKK